MYRILNNTLLLFFILFVTAGKCSDRQVQIDSLVQLLSSDAHAPEERVDIMTQLVVKYRYRTKEALALTFEIDSICTANDLHYKAGINYFNRTLYYNNKKLLDSSYVASIKMIDSTASLMEDSQDLSLYYHWAYANFYLSTEENALSEKHLKSALIIADSLGLESKLPRIYNELALRQRLQLKYIEAIDNYLKALEYDNVKSCYTYSNLAKIYRDMEDYENQLLYAEKGRIAALDEKVKNVHITCRLDKARAYYRMGMLDTSEMYLLETLPYIKDSNVKNRDQISGEYLARIYYNQQKWDSLENLKSTFDQYGDGRYHAVYYALLGRSYLDRNQVSKAKVHCERAFEAGDPVNSTYWTRDACNCLIDVYKKTSNYKLALAMSGHARLMDSLSNDKEMFINITKGLNLKDLQQQKKLFTLEQDQKTQLSNNKLLRTRLLSSFIGLLFVVAFFSYWQLRKKNLKIAKQNVTIKASIEEKNTLLKEIHHRVKNNLQIISSLLSMQMRHVKDDSTKQVLSEGKNRIRSIALIHQSLYQNSNINQLSIEDYIKEMIENLFATYKIDENNVKLDLEIEDINLDVETMISLGLILNELLTNCLKHAFENNQNGRIYIQLNEIDGQLILIVQDNGKGIDEIQFSKNSSFGNKLLRAFSNKLKADFTVEKDEGTIVTMKIKNYQKTA